MDKIHVWLKWARGDLNPGPPPRKGGVLTGLDDGPAQVVIIYLYF